VHNVKSVRFLWLAHPLHWASGALNQIFAGYRDRALWKQ